MDGKTCDKLLAENCVPLMKHKVLNTQNKTKSQDGHKQKSMIFQFKIIIKLNMLWVNYQKAVQKKCDNNVISETKTKQESFEAKRVIFWRMPSITIHKSTSVAVLFDD